MAYGQVVEVENEQGEISYMTSLFPLRTEEHLEAKGGLVYTENEILGFQINVYSSEILHLDDDEVFFTIDGRKTKYTVHSRDREYYPSGRSYLTLVKLNLVIEISFLEAIAKSEIARFTVGLNTYEFTPSAKIVAGSMIDRIQKKNTN